jgi:hypothetical protein
MFDSTSTSRLEVLSISRLDHRNSTLHVGENVYGVLKHFFKLRRRRHGISTSRLAVIQLASQIQVYNETCLLTHTFSRKGTKGDEPGCFSAARFPIFLRSRMKAFPVNYSIPTYTAQNYYRIHDITIAYISKILLSHIS